MIYMHEQEGVKGMIKTYVDFELRQPLEKTADEAMDEITETLFNRVRNGKAKEIQALARAAKDIAIAKAVLSRINS